MQSDFRAVLGMIGAKNVVLMTLDMLEKGRGWILMRAESWLTPTNDSIVSELVH